MNGKQILFLLLLYSHRFTTLLAQPFRTIVNAKENLSDESSPKDGLKYTPVFERYNGKRERNRELLQETRARNPKRYKELNAKHYRLRKG